MKFKKFRLTTGKRLEVFVQEYVVFIQLKRSRFHEVEKKHISLKEQTF